MSDPIQDDVNHEHCEKGLFHDAEPIHTHPHCKGCFQMPRCSGLKSSSLRRCVRCNYAAYCSKECQRKDWKLGHKHVCAVLSISASRAAQLSGNPNAWVEFMEWVEYHTTTLTNATTTCFIHAKGWEPDITSKYIFHVTLDYRNDPSLPVPQKFHVRGMHFSPRSKWTRSPLLPQLFSSEIRAQVEAMGRVEMGDEYWGTGCYLLMVRFRPQQSIKIPDGLPFWKHFAIDKYRANARPACRNPLEIMEETLHEGRKLKFCCGKKEGMATCCCGGWTHAPALDVVPDVDA